MCMPKCTCNIIWVGGMTKTISKDISVVTIVVRFTETVIEIFDVTWQTKTRQK